MKQAKHINSLARPRSGTQGEPSSPVGFCYTWAMSLANRHILLGVTGGVAAYKAAELTRRLGEAGARLRVVMTPAAMRFVTPLTFQALSGEPVRSELFDPQAEAAMGHIQLARWAEAVLVAPASADFMARLAQGLAGDLLSTLCLATQAPIVLAPAMNRAMWSHPATQANVQRLDARGVRILGPASGPQACGEEGEGRMLEPRQIVQALSGLWQAGVLEGIRVLVTAGPTREPIDPVRYLSNRSSGRMGFALAEAAARAGARVTLVAGPVALPTPPGVRRLDVDSARAMHQAVMQTVADAQIFIACAAVADYRPEAPSTAKLKKTRDTLTLRLVRNPDIAAEVAARDPAPFVLGFAAETEDLERHARAKLQAKGFDMIAANRVGEPGLGFEAEHNALEVYWPGGHRSLPRTDKARLARELIQLMAKHYAAHPQRVVSIHGPHHRGQGPG